MVQALRLAAEKIADKTVDVLLPKAKAHASHCVNCPSGPYQCNYFCCGHQISHIHYWRCCLLPSGGGSYTCSCEIVIVDYC